MTLGNLWLGIILILMAAMAIGFVMFGWTPILTRLSWVVCFMAIIVAMTEGEEQ